MSSYAADWGHPSFWPVVWPFYVLPPNVTNAANPMKIDPLHRHRSSAMNCHDASGYPMIPKCWTLLRNVNNVYVPVPLRWKMLSNCWPLRSTSFPRHRHCSCSAGWVRNFHFVSPSIDVCGCAAMWTMSCHHCRAACCHPSVVWPWRVVAVRQGCVAGPNLRRRHRDDCVVCVRHRQVRPGRERRREKGKLVKHLIWGKFLVWQFWRFLGGFILIPKFSSETQSVPENNFCHHHHQRWWLLWFRLPRSAYHRSWDLFSF